MWKVTTTNNNIDSVSKVTSIDHDLTSGVYTTLKLFPGNKVYQFQRHMQRLAESAQLSGFNFSLSETNLRKSLRSIVEQFHTEPLKVQILVFPQNEDLVIYLLINKATVYKDGGVNTITRSLSRNNPKAKRTDFIIRSTEEKNSMPNGIEEILMVNNEGIILEGMSSNFYGVCKNKLWTAEEGVLFGTTRKTILNIVNDIGLDVDLEGFRLDKLPQLDEAFISSVSRGVLPVIRINDQQIGSGKPGDITVLIKQKYDELLNKDLEAL